MSFHPSLSKSKNPAPKPRYFVLMPSPSSKLASKKVPSPLFQYKVVIWSEKLVRTMSSQPSPSKSATPTPMPPRASPFSLKAQPAATPISLNVPSPLFR